MEIKELSRDKSALVVGISGRLDSETSPDAEIMLRGLVDGANALELDFSELDYISSAGLRVLLAIQKLMGDDVTISIRNASVEVTDILTFTGFHEIFTVIE